MSNAYSAVLENSGVCLTYGYGLIIALLEEISDKIYVILEEISDKIYVILEEISDKIYVIRNT